MYLWNTVWNISPLWNTVWNISPLWNTVWNISPLWNTVWNISPLWNTVWNISYLQDTSLKDNLSVPLLFDKSRNKVLHFGQVDFEVTYWDNDIKQVRYQTNKRRWFVYTNFCGLSVPLSKCSIVNVSCY